MVRTTIGRLAVGVRLTDDGLIGGESQRIASGSGEDTMLGEEFVDVAGEADLAVGEHDQVVADPLDVAQQVR